MVEQTLQGHSYKIRSHQNALSQKAIHHYNLEENVVTILLCFTMR